MPILAHLIFWPAALLAIFCLGSLTKWNPAAVILGLLCILFWAALLTILFHGILPPSELFP